MKRTKILFLMQMPPPDTGAALRNRELFSIVKENEAYTVRSIPFVFSKNVSGLSVFSITKVLKAFFIWLKIFSHMVITRPDIVYFTPAPYGFAYYRDILNILLVKLFRKKIVLHLRMRGFRSGSGKNALIRRINRIIFSNVFVVALSDFGKTDIPDDADPVLFVLNDGIGTPGVDRAPQKSEGKAPVVTFYSNLFFAKGIVDYLEIMSMLNKAGVPFEGRIYGNEGNISGDQLNRFIDKSGLRGKVKYYGGIDDNDRSRVFEGTDIFVFPTHFDSFPGVVLEAMRSGVPVVSVLEGGIPEMVSEGETGFLHRKGDQTGMADSIRFLIENPSIGREMGEKGRERFLRHFSIEKFRENLLVMLKSIDEYKIKGRNGVKLQGYGQEFENIHRRS